MPTSLPDLEPSVKSKIEIEIPKIKRAPLLGREDKLKSKHIQKTPFLVSYPLKTAALKFHHVVVTNLSYYQ